MSKLELSILVGAESKEWLNQITRLVERMEKLAQLASPATPADKPAPAKTATNGKGKAPAKVEEPEESDETFDLDGEAEEPEEKLTLKDVIAACKENRDEAVKVLKKMKVKSIHELKPNQYRSVLDQLGA